MQKTRLPIVVHHQPNLLLLLALLLSFNLSGKATVQTESATVENGNSNGLHFNQEKIDSLLNGFEEIVVKNAQQALENAQMALDSSVFYNYDRGAAKSHYQLGRAYFELNDNSQAKQYLEEGLKLSTSVQDSISMIDCYKWLGSLQRSQGDLDEALRYYLLSMNLAKEIGFIEGVARNMQNIALVYGDQKNHTKAIEYFQEGLKIMESKYYRSICLANLGMSYAAVDSTDRALESYAESISLCKQIENPQCELFPLSLIAEYYTHNEEYDKAMEYALDILEAALLSDSKDVLMINNNRIGNIYLGLENFEKAVEYFSASLIYAKEIRSKSIPYIHANLSLAHAGLNDHETALDHVWKFYYLNDSISNLHQTQQTEEMLAKFDVERKEQQIKLLQKEKDLQEAEAKRQSIVKNIAIVGALISMLAAAIFWWVYSQKIKIQKELARSKEEINLQKTKELQRESEIQSILSNIEGQEKERKRIAKDLHDGIAGNLATIKLNLKRIAQLKKDKHELQEVVADINKTYSEVRTISHHLMPISLQERPFVETLNNYLHEIDEINDFQIGYNYHPMDDINELPQNVKLEIYRIIQEIINNIQKHASAKTIDLQLIINENTLNLLVEDDGKGFDTSATTKGIGLINIESRVEILGGTLDIDSAVGRGTTVNLEVPVAKKVEDINKTKSAS